MELEQVLLGCDKLQEKSGFWDWIMSLGGKGSSGNSNGTASNSNTTGNTAQGATNNNGNTAASNGQSGGETIPLTPELQKSLTSLQQQLSVADQFETTSNRTQAADNKAAVSNAKQQAGNTVADKLGRVAGNVKGAVTNLGDNFDAAVDQGRAASNAAQAGQNIATATATGNATANLNTAQTALAQSEAAKQQATQAAFQAKGGQGQLKSSEPLADWLKRYEYMNRLQEKQQTQSKQILQVVQNALKTKQVPIDLPKQLAYIDNITDPTGKFATTQQAIKTATQELQSLIQSGQGLSITDEDKNVVNIIKKTLEQVTNKKFTNDLSGKKRKYQAAEGTNNAK